MHEDSYRAEFIYTFWIPILESVGHMSRVIGFL